MKDYQAKADHIIQSVIQNIKQEDIVHRGFLKPIEIALKTSQTQHDNKDQQGNQSKVKMDAKTLKPGSLPKGLKIAVKEDLMKDKRIYKDFAQFNSQKSFDWLKNNNQDNILSLMKKETGFKLAICVCMFREDKKMLKNTLRGIEENIANLVAYEQINPDNIGVFVMMDGIQQVHQSIVDYFEELERSSNINLGENIVPQLTMKQIADRGMYMSVEQIDQMQVKNVNNYLFDVAELEERNSIRFPQVKKEYNQIKDLLKQIQRLKSGRPLFEDLHPKLKPYFFEQAKQQRKKQYALTDKDIQQQLQGQSSKEQEKLKGQLSKQQQKIKAKRVKQKAQLAKYRMQTKLHEDYALDLTKARPLVMRALQDGEQFCKEYISSRDDLAHLSCFRKKIPFSQEVIKKLRPQNEGRQRIYGDQTQQIQNYTVMNLFMCVKYKNGGKLSSHNWFFNGFCRELRPQHAILLDVGLKPEETALMKMYRYLQKNKRIGPTGGVGGVCGYMSIKIQQVDSKQVVKDEEVDFLTGIISKFTDIQRTQQVEYHFAHLMDKGFESAFSFIHVLPGAFSAYNMQAIVDYDSQQDDELLKDYFKSINDKLKNGRLVKSEISVGKLLLKTFLPDFINKCFIHIDPESEQALLYRQNVYLAEDRILCMGIHKRGYDMSFLPDAFAEVDPIKTVHQLLGQRKRWINGSYFAFESVKQQLSDHSKSNSCEFFLNLQILYLSLMNTLSYFSPAFFLFSAFRADVLTKLLNGVVDNPNSSQFYNAFVFTIDFIYVLLIMTIVFFSLHLNNKDKKFIPYIYGISTIFGLFMVCVFLVLIVDIFRGLFDDTSFLLQNINLTQYLPGGITIINILRWVLAGSVLIYILPISIYSIFFKRVHILCEIIMGGFSFLFFSPTYLNILNIYSLCRIDDFSWGTKGLDAQKNKNLEIMSTWKWLKYVHVLKYVVWNVVFGAVLLTLGSGYTPRFFVTIGMVAIISFVMFIKILLACLYMIKYWCVYHPRDQTPSPGKQSSISIIIKSFEGNIKQEILQHLQGVKKEYMKQQAYNVSFIQASRKGDKAKNSFKKQQQLQKNKSGITKYGVKNNKKPLPSLPTIQEEPYQDRRRNNNRQPHVKVLKDQEGKQMAQSFASNQELLGRGLQNQTRQLDPNISPQRQKMNSSAANLFQTVPKDKIDKEKFKKKNSK